MEKDKKRIRKISTMAEMQAALQAAFNAINKDFYGGELEKGENEMKTKIYCIIDTTEFLHPFKIAYFLFKDDAKNFLKLIKKKYPANTYILSDF